ncbi:hypothetical protein F5Y15DRAFT_414585 [Xylariaceae sp. FL0016]|nr:hypothetical protein F5Y15DRAFT_414585 [Xylariaceae sp. FL0016]
MSDQESLHASRTAGKDISRPQDSGRDEAHASSNSAGSNNSLTFTETVRSATLIRSESSKRSDRWCYVKEKVIDFVRSPNEQVTRFRGRSSSRAPSPLPGYRPLYSPEPSNLDNEVLHRTIARTNLTSDAGPASPSPIRTPFPRQFKIFRQRTSGSMSDTGGAMDLSAGPRGSSHPEGDQSLISLSYSQRQSAQSVAEGTDQKEKEKRLSEKLIEKWKGRRDTGSTTVTGTRTSIESGSNYDDNRDDADSALGSGDTQAQQQGQQQSFSDKFMGKWKGKPKQKDPLHQWMVDHSGGTLRENGR